MLCKISPSIPGQVTAEATLVVIIFHSCKTGESFVGTVWKLVFSLPGKVVQLQLLTELQLILGFLAMQTAWARAEQRSGFGKGEPLLQWGSFIHPKSITCGRTRVKDAKCPSPLCLSCILWNRMGRNVLSHPLPCILDSIALQIHLGEFC